MYIGNNVGGLKLTTPLLRMTDIYPEMVIHE